ncbi:FAD-dependent 5-carboxymethylaminomethyl-2-thiouridine(34) oxidoreductase MnmC [Tepidimonas sp.]|uniref:FAD-dependent 5-carboxymethylaminomethyl-2-thiouridine(34) oxidoreductase MnmC n=1 Tax=Tepidimonas sp. TaxID=2002775 RepID=UPI002FE318E3
MQAQVQWLPDGTPRSPRFGDIYRSRGADGRGGLAQARHVFLTGCGLWSPAGPTVWAGQPHWHLLENGFGLGLNALATWHAWLADEAAPATLFYSATEAYPASADDVRRSAAAFAELRPLAEWLAARFDGLLPGVHRWTWYGADAAGRARTLHLTLLVGDATRTLPTLDVAVDSVFLDGFNPEVNPEMWGPEVLRAVARLSRPGTRLATWTVARVVRDGLRAVGFEVDKAPGLPPKRHCLRAVYTPRWTPRTVLRQPQWPPATPREAVIIGAGLAGAAAAWSLAQRGWQVTVLDAAAQPAAGASGLPVGLVAPHVSPDDAPLSRLTRAGVTATLERAAALLRPGIDWASSGVLEHRGAGKRALPSADLWQPQGHAWSAPADAARLHDAGLPPGTPALWHARAAWLRPARLVAAQLAHPCIALRLGAAVEHLQRDAQRGEWAVHGRGRAVLARAPLVVLSAGFDTRALLANIGDATLPLHALRGQVAWGALDRLDSRARAALPPFPVNGHGSLISGVPGDDGSPLWCMGSTFVRGVTDRTPNDAEHSANWDKLHRLLPPAATALRTAWPQTQRWAAVRCTLPDRLPAVGPVDSARWPGLHVLTALGARGLTLSVLCGEVLAAGLHGEPWPLERALAAALRASRFAPVCAKGDPQSP